MNAAGVLQVRRLPVLAVAAGWATVAITTIAFLGKFDFETKFGRSLIPWIGVLGVLPPVLLVARDVLAVEDGDRPLADIFFYFVLSLLGFGLAYFSMSIGDFQLDGVMTPWRGPGDQFHNSPTLTFASAFSAFVDSLFVSCRGLMFQGLTASFASPTQKLLAVAQATTSFGMTLLAVKSLGRRRAG